MLAARHDAQAKGRPLSVGLRFAILTFAFIFSLAAAANAKNAEPSDPNGHDGHPNGPSELVSDEISLRGSIGPQARSASTICQLIESAAAANGLPVDFFARVIWEESRFRPDAVGPLTRSGHKAQGIAQFMPMTAAERLLRDPFDPAQALPKSAEFLRDLRAQFGNLGLAAAAYNAGPQRVRDWLAGKRTLPAETQKYVRNVTGRSAQEWARPDQKSLTLTISTEMSCAQIQSAKLVAKPQSPSAV